MLFWTPILEYIKIRPSPISKLSPDALAPVKICLVYYIMIEEVLYFVE